MEFPDDSKLEKIEASVFGGSLIESFRVPPHLTTIPGDAFGFCKQLKVFEAPENSELKTIEDYAFCDLPIEDITLPSKFVEFQEKWAFHTGNIKKIKILPYNPLFHSVEDKFIYGKSLPNNDVYDVFVFSVFNINFVFIPAFIKIIGVSAFNGTNIIKVRFQSDSNLKIIDKYAFAYSALTGIALPSSLTSVGMHAFDSCDLLKKVLIPYDSQLQIINESAFARTSIQSFYVPSKVTQIHELAFDKCDQLQIFEIGDDVVYEFENTDFINNLNGLIMISANKRSSIIKK